MANHKSAAKRARQTIKRTERNRATKAKVRTLSKKVEAAVSANDKKAAGEAVKAATRAVQKAATKGVIHKNTAARRQSRLAKQANKAKA